MQKGNSIQMIFKQLFINIIIKKYNKRGIYAKTG